MEFKLNAERTQNRIFLPASKVSMGSLVNACVFSLKPQWIFLGLLTGNGWRSIEIK